MALFGGAADSVCWGRGATGAVCCAASVSTRSGSAAFVERLSGDSEADLNLIGQFGVGFYASFMVANRVEVVTRATGEEAAWRWRSDGKGEYTVAPAARERAGTTVTLHLRKDQDRKSTRLNSSH